MLARVSYARAEAVLLDQNHGGTSSTDKDMMRTDKDMMRRALSHFEIATSRNLVRCTKSPIRFYSDRDALIRTNVLKNGNWHWVVWDSGSKKICDPLPYRRGLKLYSYLDIL
jgi:hypothetical protein